MGKGGYSSFSSPKSTTDYNYLALCINLCIYGPRVTVDKQIILTVVQ